MTTILQEIYDFAIQMWVELFFVCCSAIAFALLQMASRKQASKFAKKKIQQFKVIHAEATPGNAAQAVSAWRATKALEVASCETLKVVTQAFLDDEPLALAGELFEHFSLHISAFYDSHLRNVSVAVLEVVARAGHQEVMEDLFQMFTERLHVPANVRLHEAMLSGYATAGNEKKVAQLAAKLLEGGQKVSVRGHSLTIKGFLKNGMLDTALTQIREMRSQSLTVPPFAITELFRAARDSGRTAEVFNSFCADISMTADAVAIVLEVCVTSQDLALAKTVEKAARDANVQMTFGAYEALLKLCTSAGDNHAFKVFEEMQRLFSYISEGLVVSLISRCAEPKFYRFAEVIVAFQRSRGKMTMVTYSALMKVYSYANMYDQACDIYDQMRTDGLEPDSTMYGCLMKFSAECGRTDLTRELFSKVGGLDVHHHMALIRAAGQDKDVDKAFRILADLRGSGVQLDTLVYNSVLDVCSSAGDMKRARKLVADMRSDGIIDIVSYNTLLKGCGKCGDTNGAKEVIAEMEKVGLPPNDVSYNCLINIAASSGDFRAAWETIETMERKGIAIDHYTVSTMMKALKHGQTSRGAVNRVMALLDRHGIDVCCEEVLLNTTVEACIKHCEHKRLAELVNRVDSKKHTIQLAQHSYATLIRACGILKRVNRCRELWTEMTEVKGHEPNGVSLGCILDALVCNGCVVEGVKLLRKWQDRVKVNTVLYSTLIKGFANISDNKRAEEMWQELCTAGLPLNTMVYNAIIDAHARSGAMDRVTALIGSMDAAGCKPDDISWSMVAKGYCVTGELDRALEVFHSLPAGSNANTVIIYNTILDGCVRHNRSDLADKMLENMEEWHIEPSNFTLGIVVKMWGRRRQLKRALAAVETLPKRYGFTPNGPVQTCLLFACLRNDALDTALAVFQNIRDTGIPVDSKVFTALINNCTRSGRFERAVALVEEAYGLAAGSAESRPWSKASRVIPSGDDLDPACLEQLLKLLSKQGILQKVGVPLLQKMRSAKVAVSPHIMSVSLGAEAPCRNTK